MESWIEEREMDLEDLQDESPPELVNLAPRLTLDVEALEKLTSSKEPAETKCRVRTALTALYLMGDASGQGFDQICGMVRVCGMKLLIGKITTETNYQTGRRRTT